MIWAGRITFCAPLMPRKPVLRPAWGFRVYATKTKFMPSPFFRRAAHRLRAENEARLFQFQDHLNSLLNSEAAPSLLEAGDHFRFLPAAGLLPLATTTRVGFSAESFFHGVPHREPPPFINGEQLRPILDQSWNYEPVDLAVRIARDVSQNDVAFGLFA